MCGLGSCSIKACKKRTDTGLIGKIFRSGAARWCKIYINKIQKSKTLKPLTKEILDDQKLSNLVYGSTPRKRNMYSPEMV